MVAATRNAYIVAKFLDAHPLVEKVNYPGLPNNSEHALCRKQMRGTGGMLSFYIKGNLEQAKKCVKAFKVLTLAESLGGVESNPPHPPTTP